VLLPVLVSLTGFAALVPVHIPPPSAERDGLRRCILRLEDAPPCRVS